MQPHAKGRDPGRNTLQSTKLPLTVWLPGIYLLAQGRNGISALELDTRQLNVNDYTVWIPKEELLPAMQEPDRGRKMRGTAQIDDASIGAEQRGGKRSRG